MSNKITKYQAEYIPLQGWKPQVYSVYLGYYVTIGMAPIFTIPNAAIHWAMENWER